MRLVLKDRLDVGREEALATMGELFVAIEDFLTWVDQDPKHRVSEETVRLAEAYIAVFQTLCEEVGE